MARFASSAGRPVNCAESTRRSPSECGTYVASSHSSASGATTTFTGSS